VAMVDGPRASLLNLAVSCGIPCEQRVGAVHLPLGVDGAPLGAVAAAPSDAVVAAPFGAVAAAPSDAVVAAPFGAVAAAAPFVAVAAALFVAVVAAPFAAVVATPFGVVAAQFGAAAATAAAVAASGKVSVAIVEMMALAGATNHPRTVRVAADLSMLAPWRHLAAET